MQSTEVQSTEVQSTEVQSTEVQSTEVKNTGAKYSSAKYWSAKYWILKEYWSEYKHMEQYLRNGNNLMNANWTHIIRILRLNGKMWIRAVKTYQFILTEINKR